jgi:hypothetical protein
MTTPLARRRAQLRDLYGFDFPDDLFRFWDFVCRLRPLEPLLALSEDLHLVLVGPFEVLAGRFDGPPPRSSLHLHWRYYDDPPEFFTVLAGDTDGLHWGHYLDDPAAGGGCVASYYTHDAYELSVDGDDLFEAVRLHLEESYRDYEDYRDEDDEDAADYEADLARLAELRQRLQHYATGERPEVGDEYVEAYRGASSRQDRVVAATAEGMGIVVPPERYRPLSLRDKKLWSRLRKEEDPAELVEEARRALQDGYPGTALKLGKDLWATTGPTKAAYASELLDAAYAALGREVLRQVLHTHQAHRDRPAVDVLEAEADDEREA